MYRIFRFLFIGIFLFEFSSASAQNIKINEVMSSNSSSIQDDDGDFPDWIEFYNSGETEVNLSGFGLSDKPDKPFKWVFPAVTLKAGEYIVIYASDKDRRDDLLNLHTNFKLSAEGEEVLLTDPDGVRVDEVAFQMIRTDVSYGRKTDGALEFAFFTQSTPGASNVGESYSSIVQAPAFSHSAGFYESGFELTISSSDPEASIFYTTDGSVPDAEKLSGFTYNYKNTYPEEPGQPFGQMLNSTYKTISYAGPVEINDRSFKQDVFSKISSTYDNYPSYFPNLPVFKGLVVKAMAVKPGALPSEVVTNTYFVTEQGINRYSLPVVSISAQPDRLFSYENGIYVAGTDFDNWRGSNPNRYPNGSTPANYRRSGDEWEVPAHFELFDGGKGRVLSQDIGIRIHGGWTRAFPAKSLRLYARNEYGESHFNYPVFTDEPYEAYKRLVLRNSGNDFGSSMFRDAAFHSIVKHMNIETMAYRPAVLFINSEYWGIHNFRERYDKHYFERKYGADPEGIDILEANMVPVEGNAVHYQKTIQYIENNGLRDDQHYQYIKERIDVDNFMDYQIAQIFSGNADWPGNNMKYWRVKTPSTDAGAPEELDGRWRWLLYDTDNGFGLFYNGFGQESTSRYSENSLKAATEPRGPGYPNPPWSTFLLRKLLENESFRNSFINRFSDQLNSAFKPEIMQDKIRSLREDVEPEIKEHIFRWKAPRSVSDWDLEVTRMLDFAEYRPNYQWTHLKNQFNLGGDYELEVDVSHADRGYVRVNTLELKAGTEGVQGSVYPWRGKYFKGVPMEVEAVPFQGYRFERWEGIESTSPAVTIKPNADVALIAVFRKVVSGIEEEEELRTRVVVFPNPTEGDTRLKITVLKSEEVKISLHDLTGKIIHKMADKHLAAGIHEFSLATGSYLPGVYVVRCEFRDKRVHYKLVKK